MNRAPKVIKTNAADQTSADYQTDRLTDLPLPKEQAERLKGGEDYLGDGSTDTEGGRRPTTVSVKIRKPGK